MEEVCSWAEREQKRSPPLVFQKFSFQFSYTWENFIRPTFREDGCSRFYFRKVLLRRRRRSLNRSWLFFSYLFKITSFWLFVKIKAIFTDHTPVSTHQ